MTIISLSYQILLYLEILPSDLRLSRDLEYSSSSKLKFPMWETWVSDKKISKTALYRYAARDDLAWRNLQLQLVYKLVSRTSRLTSDTRKKCFIFDDSIYNRNRSKNTELLARVYDHCSHRYLWGFNYHMLSWTDGNSTYPIDFAVMFGVGDKNCINKTLDRRP